MKKFILINLNQTDSKEARTARLKERGRWMVFTVIVLSLIFANTSLFLIGSGYNRLIAQKENEIADVKQRIRNLQTQGKNLSKQDILSFAELEGNRTLWARNFELLGKMTPGDMALTSLKFNKRNKKLYIEGISVVYKEEEEYEIVYNYINRMKRNREFSKNFPKVKFRQGSLKKIRGQDIVHFEIEAALKTTTKKRKRKS
jgi:Tfp pilus assembly protein PilN